MGRLDFSLSLLDPQLSLDSLDLAEVMVGVEREFQCAPFDTDPPPRTWADILRIIESHQDAEMSCSSATGTGTLTQVGRFDGSAA